MLLVNVGAKKTRNSHLFLYVIVEDELEDEIVLYLLEVYVPSM